MLEFRYVDASKKAVWLVRCDCGVEKELRVASLISGKTVSCGCKKSETLGKIATKHGFNKGGMRPREYIAWANMIRRCYNKKGDKWKYYGGRGIRVCPEWKGSFEAFFRDMGKCPKGLTLERLDNDKNYGPDNCVWATWKVQQNHKRNSTALMVNGKVQTYAQWEDEVGLPEGYVSNRLRRGWAPERAISPLTR